MNFLLILFSYYIFNQINITHGKYKSFKNDVILKIFGDNHEAILQLNMIVFKNTDGIEMSPDMLTFRKEYQQALYYIPRQIYSQVLQYLNETNLNYVETRNNLDKKIKLEKILNKQQKDSSGRTRRGTDSDNTDYYMRYVEIRDWLLSKSRQYSFIRSEVMGKTAEGRDLLLLKISTGRTKPIIWIDAGIHAREWISPATAIFAIKKILEQSDESKWLLDNYQIYIAPLLNPDGYEYSHTINRMWRKNRSPSIKLYCYGVDLNRNFPYRWGGGGASQMPCSPVYRGEKAESELETQAVVKTLDVLKSNVKLFITLHSFGQYILMPYAYTTYRYMRNYYNTIKMGTRVSAQLQEKYGRFYRVGSASNLLYEASGTSDDFAAGSMNIPYTFTIELPDRGRYGFLLPPTYIGSVGEQFWKTLITFSKDIAKF